MRFWSIDGFVDEEFETGPCLIEPFFPSKGIGLLHGRQTSGKTQLALTLARAVAAGEPFLGKFPCYQGPVLYFQVDMPEALLQDRFRVHPEAWRGLPLTIFCNNNRINILNPKTDVCKALEIANAMSPVLCIVDSLRKTHQMEENSSDTPTKVYGAWKDHLPDSAFLFLHHETKLQSDGPPKAPEDRARGSTAWLDDADFGMSITRTAKHEGNGHTANLVWTKQRAGAQSRVPQMNVKLDDDTLLVVPAEETTARQHGEIFLSTCGGDADRDEFHKYVMEKTGCKVEHARKIWRKLRSEN